MSKLVLCAATPTSGVRHRYLLMRQVKNFAERFGHSVCMLWGVTSGVSFCRHEELFAPVPGIHLENTSSEELKAITSCVASGAPVRYKGESLKVLRPGAAPLDRFFSWDLDGSGALAKLNPGAMKSLPAKPCATLQAQLDAYVKKNEINDRLGIRVRVDELPQQKRKPHRIQSELDAVLRSLLRIPWYARVFIATDSEYIQQALVSHFVDSRFLPKKFDLQHPTGRYVHRCDKQAMVTFIKEVSFLCACRKVINIGGFLNDGLVHSRLIQEPYDAAAFLHVQKA